MDTWLGIVIIAAGLFYAVKEIRSFRARRRQSKSTPADHIAMPAFSTFRIAVGWLVSFIVINVLGWLMVFGADGMPENEWKALWIVCFFIGWLGMSCVVHRIVLPKPYLKYWDERPTAPRLAYPGAMAMLFWIVMLIGGNWSYLNDLN